MSGGSWGYGIIGCGWVAPSHACGVETLEGEGVRLIGAADPDRGRAEALAQAFRIPHVYADYRDLLARDDVQVVSVCVPDFLHRQVTVDAARRGKHVLCEKPLARTVEEVDEMVAACAEHGVQLGLVMNHRYAPGIRRTKRAIEAGSLGRLLMGSALHSSALASDPSSPSSPWRGRRGLAAGGVLSTQAIHFLDMLLWYMGPARAVKAWTCTLSRSEQDYEDTAVLALRLRSGALASVTTTNAAPIGDDLTGTRVEVHGTEGWVLLEGDRVRRASLRAGDKLPRLHLPALPPCAAQLPFGGGHVHLVREFVAAVRQGRRPPVTALEGRHLMAVLAAASVSAREHEAVEIEDHQDAYRPTPGAGPGAGRRSEGLDTGARG